MTMIPRYQYPRYARSERIADGVIHLAGVIFALSGAVLLIVIGALHLGGAHVAALSVYGAALVASFTASAIYHFTPWEAARPLFRRLDHAAIFLKIAGTYTPLAVLIGGPFAYAVLALVWVLALVGMARKLFFWTNGASSSVFYLVLGWLSLALIWPLAQTVGWPALALIAAGGALYTGGVVFFNWEGLKYSLAIWHGFVLAASACFFAAIAGSVFAAA
ncbi:PAQR family membrane homeostasis protein TrhA [Wenxinia saemankumensis]|nr:hemolysin III family protein [Wenxinia saemankumensis]